MQRLKDYQDMSGAGELPSCSGVLHWPEPSEVCNLGS